METLAAADAVTSLKWWQLKRRLNGKFWLTMMFLFSLFLVAGSTYFRVGQAVTLDQLQRGNRLNRALLKQVVHQLDKQIRQTSALVGDWRDATTRTWGDTLTTLARAEDQRLEIMRLIRDTEATCREGASRNHGSHP